MISVKIVSPKPYTKAGSFILAEVANRIVDNAEEHGEDVSPLHQIIARAWVLDPGVLILAALSDKGLVKGHAVAGISDSKAYVLQPRVDEPTESDTIGEFIALAESWLKLYNLQVLGGEGAIPRLTLLARRADPKWAKKYGFFTKHYVMEKELV